jgi:hypothetical protein
MERLAANGITFNAETGQTVVNQAMLNGQPTPQQQQQTANRYAANLGGMN